MILESYLTFNCDTQELNFKSKDFKMADKIIGEILDCKFDKTKGQYILIVKINEEKVKEVKQLLGVK